MFINLLQRSPNSRGREYGRNSSRLEAQVALFLLAGTVVLLQVEVEGADPGTVPNTQEPAGAAALTVDPLQPEIFVLVILRETMVEDVAGGGTALHTAPALGRRQH